MDKHSQRSINNWIKYFGANLWWWRWYFVSFRNIVEVRSIIRFYSFHFIHSAFDCPHVCMHTNISQSYGCLCSCSYFFWAIANSVFSTRTNRFPANKKNYSVRCCCHKYVWIFLENARYCTQYASPFVVVSVTQTFSLWFWILFFILLIFEIC